MSTANLRYSDEKVDVSPLAKPIKLPFSGKTAKNAFMKAAMTERLSSWDQKDPTKRGTPSDALVKVYEEWGRGGWGIILSGNTMVNPMDLEAPGNPIFHKSVETPEHLAQHKKLAAGAKANGSLYIVQLSHAGRQVAEMIQPNPVSASDVKLDDRMGLSFGKPKPLTKEEIKEVINEWVYAASYAKKIGADGVELHGAHGYLLAQFLASSTNRRTDEYGGSLENRARIVYEIIEAIKKEVNDPTFSISIKLNSVEFQEGGLQPEESAQICQHLESLGVDFVELSGGTYEKLGFEHKRESTKAREAFFVEFADMIRPKLQKTKVWLTGGLQTAKGMVKILNDGSADGVGLARAACADFDLPNLILSGEASAARKSLIPADDFGMGNVAAGTQMRQVGNGHRPFDVSDEGHMGKFKALVGEFFQKQQEDGKKGIVSAGYPTLAI